MPPIYAVGLLAGLALASLLLPGTTARRTAALGIVAAALGQAGAAVTGADRLEVVSLPASTLAVDGGLVLLGTALLAAAGLHSLRRSGPPAATSAGLLLLTGAMVWMSWPLLEAAGPARAAAGALTLAATCLAVFQLGRLTGLGGALRRADARITLDAAIGSGRRPASVPAALAAAGATAAIAAPHLGFVLAGALIAAGAWPAALRQYRRAIVLTVLGALALGRAAWLMRAMAGPDGLGMSGLHDSPFSQAAETLLIPLIALGAFGFFGLWPLHGARGGVLVPVGVALLVRVASALPQGLQEWQTVLVPIGVFAVWHAAVTRRPGELLGAGAWLACVASTGEPAAAAACGLSAAAFSLTLGDLLPGRSGSILRRGAWLLAAVGGALALRPALAAEVVYTVLAVAGTAVAIASGAPKPAAPLAGAPT